MEKQSVSMTVNGQRYEFLIGEKFGMIPPSETLVQTLRDRLQLTGSKESCDERLRLLHRDKGRRRDRLLHDPHGAVRRRRYHYD